MPHARSKHDQQDGKRDDRAQHEGEDAPAMPSVGVIPYRRRIGHDMLPGSLTLSSASIQRSSVAMDS